MDDSHSTSSGEKRGELVETLMEMEKNRILDYVDKMEKAGGGVKPPRRLFVSQDVSHTMPKDDDTGHPDYAGALSPDSPESPNYGETFYGNSAAEVTESWVASAEGAMNGGEWRHVGVENVGWSPEQWRPQVSGYSHNEKDFSDGLADTDGDVESSEVSTVEEGSLGDVTVVGLKGEGSIADRWKNRMLEVEKKEKEKLEKMQKKKMKEFGHKGSEEDEVEASSGHKKRDYRKEVIARRMDRSKRRTTLSGPVTTSPPEIVPTKEKSLSPEVPKKPARSPFFSPLKLESPFIFESPPEPSNLPTENSSFRSATSERSSFVKERSTFAPVKLDFSPKANAKPSFSDEPRAPVPAPVEVISPTRTEPRSPPPKSSGRQWMTTASMLAAQKTPPPTSPTPVFTAWKKPEPAESAKNTTPVTSFLTRTTTSATSERSSIVKENSTFAPLRRNVLHTPDETPKTHLESKVVDKTVKETSHITETPSTRHTRAPRELTPIEKQMRQFNITLEPLDCDSRTNSSVMSDDTETDTDDLDLEKIKEEYNKALELKRMEWGKRTNRQSFPGATIKRTITSHYGSPRAHPQESPAHKEVKGEEHKGQESWHSSFVQEKMDKAQELKEKLMQAPSPRPGSWHAGQYQSTPFKLDPVPVITSPKQKITNRDAEIEKKKQEYRREIDAWKKRNTFDFRDSKGVDDRLKFPLRGESIQRPFSYTRHDPIHDPNLSSTIGPSIRPDENQFGRNRRERWSFYGRPDEVINRSYRGNQSYDFTSQETTKQEPVKKEEPKVIEAATLPPERAHLYPSVSPGICEMRGGHWKQKDSLTKEVEALFKDANKSPPVSVRIDYTPKNPYESPEFLGLVPPKQDEGVTRSNLEELWNKHERDHVLDTEVVKPNVKGDSIKRWATVLGTKGESSRDEWLSAYKDKVFEKLQENNQLEVLRRSEETRQADSAKIKRRITILGTDRDLKQLNESNQSEKVDFIPLYSHSTLEYKEIKPDPPTYSDVLLKRRSQEPPTKTATIYREIERPREPPQMQYVRADPAKRNKLPEQISRVEYRTVVSPPPFDARSESSQFDDRSTLIGSVISEENETIDLKPYGPGSHKRMEIGPSRHTTLSSVSEDHLPQKHVERDTLSTAGSSISWSTLPRMSSTPVPGTVNAQVEKAASERSFRTHSLRRSNSLDPSKRGKRIRSEVTMKMKRVTSPNSSFDESTQRHSLSPGVYIQPTAVSPSTKSPGEKRFFLGGGKDGRLRKNQFFREGGMVGQKLTSEKSESLTDNDNEDTDTVTLESDSTMDSTDLEEILTQYMEGMEDEDFDETADGDKTITDMEKTLNLEEQTENDVSKAEEEALDDVNPDENCSKKEEELPGEKIDEPKKGPDIVTVKEDNSEVGEEIKVEIVDEFDEVQNGVDDPEEDGDRSLNLEGINEPEVKTDPAEELSDEPNNEVSDTEPEKETLLDEFKEDRCIIESGVELFMDEENEEEKEENFMDEEKEARFYIESGKEPHKNGENDEEREEKVDYIIKRKITTETVSSKPVKTNGINTDLQHLVTNGNNQSKSNQVHNNNEGEINIKSILSQSSQDGDTISLTTESECSETSSQRVKHVSFADIEELIDGDISDDLTSISDEDSEGEDESPFPQWIYDIIYDENLRDKEVEEKIEQVYREHIEELIKRGEDEEEYEEEDDDEDEEQEQEESKRNKDHDESGKELFISD